MRTLIPLLLVLSLTFYTVQSRVREIDCQINQTPCQKEISQEFTGFLGERLLFLKTEPKVKELKASYSHWEKVKVRKAPFHRVIVLITTRQPVVCLVLDNQYLLLDKEAIIVQEVSVNPGLPEIKINSFDYQVMKKALEAIRLLEKYALGFKQVELNESDQMVIVINGTKVFLPLTDLPKKIASLQMIISQAKIEGCLPRKVDLRFNKPIINY